MADAFSERSPILRKAPYAYTSLVLALQVEKVS